MKWNKFSEVKPDLNREIFMFLDGKFTQGSLSDYGLHTASFDDHGCGCCAGCLNEDDVWWTYDIPEKPTGA